MAETVQQSDGFTIENHLNQDENTLPFGLFKPELEGKLTWVCGQGTDGKIVSMFCMDVGDGKNERQVSTLEDLERAKYMRTELLANGWKPLNPPKVEFKVVNKDGMRVNPNRAQRRFLERKAKQFSKQQAGLGNTGANERSE